MLAFFASAEVAPPSAGLTGALVVENLVDGGLLQEIAFRALVLYALVRAWGSTRGGIARAVPVSAVLFSAFHLVNLAAGPHCRPRCFRWSTPCWRGSAWQ